MSSQISNKIIVIITGIFLICLISYFIIHRLTLAQNTQYSLIIQNFINEQALNNKAKEYKDARKIVNADLDGDGKNEIIILYSLESFEDTNLYLQYLAVFGSFENEVEFITQKIVGGKQIGRVELESVNNERVNLIEWTYSPTDSSCCPSKKENKQLELSNNRLKEIQK